MKPILLLQFVNAIITLLLVGVVVDYVDPANGWQKLTVVIGTTSGIISIIVSLVSAYEK